jgi:hypothetical protein
MHFILPREEIYGQAAPVISPDAMCSAFDPQPALSAYPYRFST